MTGPQPPVHLNALSTTHISAQSTSTQRDTTPLVPHSSRPQPSLYPCLALRYDPRCSAPLTPGPWRYSTARASALAEASACFCASLNHRPSPFWLVPDPPAPGNTLFFCPTVVVTIVSSCCCGRFADWQTFPFVCVYFSTFFEPCRPSRRRPRCR